MSFNIQDHLASLNILKEESVQYVCECPICGGSNLKINKKSGAYKCWSGDCESKAIRDAVAPWEQRNSVANTFIKVRPKSTPIFHQYPTQDGKPLIQIKREYTGEIISGKPKKNMPQAWWDGSKWQWGSMPDEVKQQVHLYRIHEDINQKAINNGLPLLTVEGESKVDKLLSLGIAATCSIGGAGKWHQYGGVTGNYKADLVSVIGSNLVICPDRDQPGLKHAEMIAADFPGAAWLYANPNNPAWDNPSDSYDIGDWISELEAQGIDKYEISNRIVDAIEGKRSACGGVSSGSVAHEAPHTPKQYTVSNAGVGVACGATLNEVEDFVQIEANNVEFNPTEILPLELAGKLIRDAQKRNIDPVGLWQYLMPICMSLMGRETTADFDGFSAPNILWGIIVQRSGGGKSRAKKLIVSPISNWQQLAFEEFKQKRKEWLDQQKEEKTKRRDTSSAFVTTETEEAPKLRKYIFNVATPQAIVRRLADQENGCIWVRDELKGLFSSLDQFTGEGEGLEILLESWDGEDCAVDRVDVENSYHIPSSRLSVAGGIQPGKFSEVFSDPNDSQGVQARCLFAIPKELPVKRFKGYCELSDTLPTLYQWIQHQAWDKLTPTIEADNLFTQILEGFGNEPCPNEVTKAWMSKLAGQTLRMAMAIHALDCYYDRSRQIQVIQRDTVDRAYKLALYYKACFYKLQGCVAENVSGVLHKVQEKAEKLGKAALADLYRNIRTIRTLAKQEGLGIAEFTLSLCRQLEQLGKGTVTKEGDAHYYTPKKAPHATPTPKTYTPQATELCGGNDTQKHIDTQPETDSDDEEEIY